MVTEQRREYMRNYMQEYRKKHSKPREIKDAEQKQKFINSILNDPKVMKELKSEKMAESLKTSDFNSFYVDDLINEIVEEIAEVI